MSYIHIYAGLGSGIELLDLLLKYFELNLVINFCLVFCFALEHDLAVAVYYNILLELEEVFFEVLVAFLDQNFAKQLLDSSYI